MEVLLDALAGSGTLQFADRRLKVHTTGKLELIDITPAVDEFVTHSGVRSGIVLVQSLHTTAGVLLNEWEVGFRRDLAAVAEGLVPSHVRYRHDDMTVRWENLCADDAENPNGHAHLQHAMFGMPSITLGASDGRLSLGRWQRICLVEFDRARARTVLLQVLGAGRPVESRNGSSNGDGAEASN